MCLNRIRPFHTNWNGSGTGRWQMVGQRDVRILMRMLKGEKLGGVRRRPENLAGEWTSIEPTKASADGAPTTWFGNP